MPTSARRSATVRVLRATVPLSPSAAAIEEMLSAPGLDWDDLLYLADGHGITPLLFQTWRGLGLLGSIPELAAARLEQSYHDNAVRNAEARRELAEVLDLLGGAGLALLILKGLPLIDALYDDPALRYLTDADFLTPDLDTALRGLELLKANGFEPVPTRPHALNTKHLPSVWRLNGFQRRGYLYDPAQPRPVELHVSLWDLHWRGLDLRNPSDLWARSQFANWEGRGLRVLSPLDTLLHLCVHLATHVIEREARLGQLIDIGRYLCRFGLDLDWDALVEVGRRAGVARFLLPGLHAAHALLGAPLPAPSVLAHLRELTPHRLRRYAQEQGIEDLLAMDFRRPELGHSYDLTFAAAASLRETAGIVRFALFPPLQALTDQYHTSPSVLGLPLYLRHIAERGRAFLVPRWNKTN